MAEWKPSLSRDICVRAQMTFKGCKKKKRVRIDDAFYINGIEYFFVGIDETFKCFLQFG